MNYSNYRVSLDIRDTGSQALLKFNQNGTARKIVFVLTEGGKPYKLTSDCSCFLSAVKPDGTELVNDCTVDVSTGTILYDVTAQTTACVGTFDCQLTVTGKKDAEDAEAPVLFAPIFSMQVKEVVISTIDLASTSEFSALVEMIDDVKTYTGRLQSLENNADNFSEVMESYNKGELKGEKGDNGIGIPSMSAITMHSIRDGGVSVESDGLVYEGIGTMQYTEDDNTHTVNVPFCLKVPLAFGNGLAQDDHGTYITLRIDSNIITKICQDTVQDLRETVANKRDLIKPPESGTLFYVVNSLGQTSVNGSITGGKENDVVLRGENGQLELPSAAPGDTQAIRKDYADARYASLENDNALAGNLVVGGNLTVNGKTTTVESSVLQVKDKLIEVAHDNTEPLTTPAGLAAPKYDGTNSGALVFDHTGTAYVGDVVLDENGNIDVARSQLQPLATRNLSSGADGELVKWDGTKQTLESAGTSLEAIQALIADNGSAIAAEMQRATDAESDLSARISGNAAALSNKVDKVPAGSYTRLYTMNTDGSAGYAHTGTSNINAFAVVQRTTNGQIAAPNQITCPPSDDQLIAKRYADNRYALKGTGGGGAIQIHYAVRASGYGDGWKFNGSFLVPSPTNDDGRYIDVTTRPFDMGADLYPYSVSFRIGIGSVSESSYGSNGIVLTKIFAFTFSDPSLSNAHEELGVNLTSSNSTAFTGDDAPGLLAQWIDDHSYPNEDGIIIAYYAEWI